MAYVFNSQCEVRHNISLRTPEVKSKRICLPFYVYRVIAPKPVKAKALNIFQKTVLNLCRAGKCQPEDIANVLFFSRDLTSVILNELFAEEYLNQDGSLTDKGFAVLLGDISEFSNIDSENFIVGYIYQDPWSLEIYPRFDFESVLVTLDRIEQKDKEYPLLQFGTKGEPKADTAHWIIPGRFSDAPREAASPEALQILEAVARHSRAYRRIKFNLSEDENAEDLPDIPEMGKINLVDQEPSVVFLSTFLYKSPDIEMDANWSVLDPFGLGNASKRIYETISKILELDDFLGAFIKGKKQDRLISHADVEDIPLIEEALKEEILKKGLHNAENAFYYKQLEVCEEIYREVTYKKKNWKMHAFYLEISKMYELLFLKMWHDFQDDYKDINKILIPLDGKMNHLILKSIVKKANHNAIVPESLKNISGRKVFSAIKFGGASLVPKMVAAILATEGNNKHPFTAMLRADPVLLTKIVTLSDLRDSSAHYDKEKKKDKVSMAEINKSRDDMYGIIRLYVDITREKENKENEQKEKETLAK